MWIESELTRHLTPVRAPADLWNQIQRNRQRPEVRQSWVLWPVFASMLLIASSILIWQLNRARAATIDMAQLTPAEVESLSNPAVIADKKSFLSTLIGVHLRLVGLFQKPLSVQELVSNDPAEIRRWVKTNGGIEIELPDTRAANVELAGARLVPMRGTLVAAVAYRVNGEDATLLVSNKRFPVTTPKHKFSGIENIAGERLFSWDMRDQAYAIAFSGAGELHGPCLLCHIRGL